MGATERQVVVVIPAFDSEATVARAISSALGQGSAVEVVVVDDCSRDATAAAARAADDGTGRLTVLQLAQNGGPAGARNHAIAASTAPWIALLDADDIMEPGRIDALLAEAQGDAWDFVADDLFKVDEADIEGARTRLIGGDAVPATLDLRRFVTGNLDDTKGSRHEYGFLKPLMRRSFLAAHGLRYDETMRLGEDYDLYARALLAGARFRLIAPHGYLAVVRRRSLSSRHETRDLERIVICDRRLMANPGLDRETLAVIRRHHAQTLRELHWRRLIDAVRARSLGDAMRAFYAPPHVIVHLVVCLADDLRLRALGRRRRGESRIEEVT